MSGRGALLLLLVSLSATPASAQYLDPANGWPELLSPERMQARRYLRMGLALLTEAMGERDNVLDDPQHVMIDRALARFARARRVMPDDAELTYYTAYALTRWRRVGPDGDEQHRIDEAVAEWERLRAQHPDFMAERVAYELGLLHMRRHEFSEARSEYEEALRVMSPPSVRLMDTMYAPADSERALYFLYSSLDEANLRANLAEITMLVGDLPAAIDHYRAAVARTGDPLTRVLARWGLALAFARSDDHDAALEAATRAIREDPVAGYPPYAHLTARYGPLAALHVPTVFFEPACEIHAYEALGHEALARSSTDGHSPRTERAHALRSWRLFLAQGGAVTRFGAHARRQIERLEASAAETSAER